VTDHRLGGWIAPMLLRRWMRESAITTDGGSRRPRGSRTHGERIHHLAVSTGASAWSGSFDPGAEPPPDNDPRQSSPAID